MKKITLLFLLVFAIAKINGQNYQISFAGTGASSTVDSVQVENLTQCTDTVLSGSDILNLSASVGISELNSVKDNFINIYPNPNTGNCSIDFIATAEGKTTISLYNIFGKRILQMLELLSIGHHTYRLSGISNGVYLLKIESDIYSYSAKVVSTNSTLDVVKIKHIEANSAINIQTIYSGTEKLKHSKISNSVITMQYNGGDRLMLTGKSGTYRTILMLTPTNNQSVTFNFVDCTDADGNHYSVVQIDTMIWMAENLKTTRYRNGNTIPNVTDNTAWSNLTTGAYCNYNNTTNSDTINTYGRLYNWFAVNDSSNIAPQGWHVASDSEWISLTTYLGGDTIAGGKLKEKCKTHWINPNTGATNEAGFTALAGGNRASYNGLYYSFRVYGCFWSSTEIITGGGAWYRWLYFSYKYLTRSNTNQNYGQSVRCVKD